MKTPNYLIQIPDPCHENWDAMKPDAKGRFCGSCSKSVVDFSTKTDMEIKEILANTSDKKICGHFKNSQINRPLEIRIELTNLPTNVSTTRSFAIALFLVFGTFLFSCTDLNGQTVGKIEVVKTEKHSDYVKGKIKRPNIQKEDPKEIIDSTLVPLEPTINGGMRIFELPPDSAKVIETSGIMEEIPNTEHFITGEMAEVIDVEDTLTKPQCGASRNEIMTDINEEILKPESTGLNVYPNPSIGEFTISYEVVKKANVSLEILDIKGVRVKTVVDMREQHTGKYLIPIDLSDMPNGIYTRS